MSRNNDVNITININGDTHTLRAAREDVNALGRSLSNTDTIANALRGSFGKIAASVASIGALAVGVKELATSGIEANRSFENLKIQLTGLIAANSSNVSMMGKTLDAHTKWNMSMKESEGILKKLNETNAKTKFTLEEITGAFNMFYATSAGQGSREKAVQAMDSIALAAQAVGKNLGDLTPMMDSLATGTVIAASEMGSFMKIVGLTNEELKKASSEGKVYDHIIEKLAKYKELSAEAAKGYEVALGSLKNELTELSRELTKPMFDTLTAGIATFSNFIKENKATIIEWAGYITETVKHLGLLAGAFVAVKGAGILLGGALSLLQGGLVAITGILPIFTSSLTASLTAAAVLQTGLAALNKAFATLLPVATIYLIYESIDAIKALNGGLEEGANKLNSVQKFIYNFLDAFATQLQIAQMKIYQFANDLKILALKAKQFFAELDDNYNPFSDGGGAEKIKGQIRLLEEYNKSYQNLIEQYKKDSVKRRLGLEGFETNEIDGQITVINKGAKDAKARVDELKDAINSLSDKAKEKFGKTQILKDLTDDLEEAKKLLEDLRRENKDETLIKRAEKYIKDLETKIKNFSKSTNAAVSNVAALKSALKEIAEINFTDMEKKTQRVLDRYNEMLGLGINKSKAREYLESSLAKIANEHLAEFEKSEKEALERQLALRSEYYIAIGDMQNAWLIKKAELEKKYRNLIFEDGKKITKEQLDHLVKMEEKAFLTGAKVAKKSFGDIKNSWADTVSSMQKTVEDGFFNFFIGKTKSLKKALKDIGTNLMRDMISPYARALSQGISGGFGAMLGGGSNLASIASNLGLAKNNSGGWSGSVGGTPVELSSTGQILRGADALDKSTTGLLNSISSLKTAYDTLTQGVGGFTGYFTQAGSAMAKYGFAGAGAFTQGIGNGMGTLFGAGGVPAGMTQGITSGMGGSYLGAGTAQYGVMSSSPYYTAGTAAGGAMVGGAVGYGVGAGLDKAFGAQTYAPYTGAVAGAAVGGYAAIAGSLAAVPVWGWIAAAVVLAIGGMIGKSKITDWGYQVGQNLSLGLDKGLDGGVNNWKEKTKKSWFSKSVSNQTSPIDEQTQKMLNQYARATGTLLKDWTGGNFNLPARTYNKRTLIDEGFGGALLAGVTGKKYDKALRFGGAEGELEKTYRYWMEQAKKDKKETYDLISEYVGKVNSSIKSLKFETLSSGLQRVKFANDEAVEALKTLNAGLGAIGGDIEHIGRDTAAQIEKAYREALKTDFSKETVQRYEALIEAYKKAKQAQDDYTKAVLSFTQQIAQTQAGFYSAHGIDSSFINYQAIYTKFRALVGALDKDIGDGRKQGVLKNGSLGDINSWAKHFLSMSSSSLGEFLSNGNVELRKALIETLTQYKSQANSTGGHEHWTKSMADLETVNKQIAALKLAQEAKKNIELQKEQAQKQLDALKEQLSILNLQKGAVEKIGSIAKSIRDSVIDRTTSTINYRSALEQAKKAFAGGDYGSKAFGNLSDAVSHQKRFYEDTAATYEDYRLAMLRMAGEVEAITNHVTLDTIDKSIKELEDRIKKTQKELVEKSETLNQTGQDQLSMLEQQRQALIESSQKQLERMSDLLGAGSPIVRYLKDMLEYLIKPQTGADGKPKPPGIPNYTTPDNINTGVNTANGAVVKSELDKFINSTYLAVLGRSVEQSGLDYWRDQIEKGKTSKQDLAGALAASARAMTGSNDRADWIEWAKSKGYKPFADGGIVTRPTRALIGEAGYDEAVIPLDGRKLKIDAGDDFRALSKKTERLEQTMSEVKDAVKELVRYVRGIITEDGQGIYAKEKK